MIEYWIVDAGYRALVWLGPVGAVVWIAAGAIAWPASREIRRRWPAARAPIRVWAVAFASAGAALLALELAGVIFSNRWVAAGNWHWTVLSFTPLIPFAIALLLTLRRADASGLNGASRLAHRVAALLFCFLCLVFVQRISLAARFPFLGGEFHAMFAHTRDGYPVAARLAWVASTVALGFTAGALVLLVPVRWWVLALVASGLGLRHWWPVLTWEPTSPAFDALAWQLFVALPAGVFAIVGLAELLRRRLPTLTLSPDRVLHTQSPSHAPPNVPTRHPDPNP